MELLNQAIARDPAFLLAYCRLAEAHDELYFNRLRSHAESLGVGEIRNRFRFSPETGFGRGAPCPGCALFTTATSITTDARDELAIALRTLPNNARIFELSGIHRPPAGPLA